MWHGYSRWRAIGFSVMGPAHRQDGRPNQDHYHISRGKGYLLSVVSDGLGSHTYSDQGSRAACLAVEEAVQLWVRNDERKETDLLRLIQTCWLMGIRPLESSECGATCLWVIAWDDGKVLVGRLGDGMILIDAGEKSPQVMEEQKSGFANQTAALSESGVLSKWETRWFDLPAGSCLCLMTDGISEDLKREEINDVVGIFRQLNGCSISKGKRFLKHELENWTTPNHSDDKTVVVLLRR